MEADISPLEATALESWCGLRAALGEQLGRHTLKPEGVAALVVLARRAPLTVAALTDALALTKARASVLVRHLLELDLIIERVGVRDRRQSILRVAPRGENVLFELGVELGRDRLDVWSAGVAAFNRIVQKAGATAGKPLSAHQCAVLMICIGNAISTGEAARRLSLGHSTVSMAARALRRDGLAEVRPGKEDRRQAIISLTPQGAAAAAVACYVWNESLNSSSR